MANDHDVSNPTATAEFRNIELLTTGVNPTPNPDPNPNPNPNPDPTPDPTPTPSNSLNIFIDGVTQNKEVDSYGGASQNPRHKLNS